MQNFQFAFTAVLLSLSLVASDASAQQNTPEKQVGAVQGQSANQPVAGQPTVGQMGTAMPVAQRPPFDPLTPEFQKYLDQVLDYWEQKTAKVERYKCDFKRYQFDPAIRADEYSSYAEGVMRFLEPDKGMFRVDQLLFYAGVDQNGKPIFRPNDRQKYGEYWICDGQYVHIMDRNEKKCTKVELPPAMRGQQIHLSPLPFLFGIKALEVKNRYWIRPLNPPAGRQNEIWLEAFPRRMDDAQNYSRVQIVLDATDCAPKGLIVFLPNWRPDAQHRELYEFDKREVNFTMLDRINQLNVFREEFIPEQHPKDWKIIIEPYQAPGQPENGQPVPGQSQPRVAQPPAANVQTLR